MISTEAAIDMEGVNGEEDNEEERLQLVEHSVYEDMYSRILGYQ